MAIKTKIIITALLLLTATTVSASWFDWIFPQESVGGGMGTIEQLSSWRATSTPVAGITTNVSGKTIYAPYSDAYFANIISGGIATTTTLCFDDNTCMTTASAGTVTSVDMSVPTGLTIAGNPITTSGTLALSLTAGYQMLTDVASTTWDNKWDLTTGVFDPYGQATSTLSSHTTTYNHTNYNTAYGWGDWNGNIDISTDTNLAVSDPIVLTDDTLSFNGVAPTFTATTTMENLDISGDLNVDGNIYSSFIFTTSGDLQVDNIKLSDNTIEATNDSGLHIYDNASNGITVLDGGNVGIGTTGPNGRLTIKGAGTTTGINLQTQNSSGTALVTVLDSGNLGIGTTAPGAKLDIGGGGSLEFTGGNLGKIILPNSFATKIELAKGTDYMALTDATDSWDFRIDGAVTNFRFIDGSSVLMAINNDGNVGIATTSPAMKLDLYGGMMRAFNVASSTCSATTRGGIFYNQDNDSFWGCKSTGFVKLDN